jgi:methyl-accepting chemotaxis protein
MDVLRRSTELVSGGVPLRGAVEDAALLGVHARAHGSLREAVQSAERLVSAATRHRVSLEAVAERQRLLASRLSDVRGAIQRVIDVEARLGIVALNAGLEGARIEGPAGRGLMMVADEVRGLVSRATTASSEVASACEEISGELGRIDGQIGEARTHGANIVEEASRSQKAVHDADSALDDLGSELRRATGVDPELAEAVERAQSHARELVAALTILSSRQGALATSALRPMMEPLVRLLDQLDEDEDAG